jgi:lipid II:glycine glycyltransferase (peptidoglycan interpeptide bridge formation enzyme)
MAPYLLQWEAMKRCKAAGCNRYDLLGIEPPKENSKSQTPNTKTLFGSSTSWQGITEFKRKFGGLVITFPQEQMIVLRPLIKRGLDLKRKLIG